MDYFWPGYVILFLLEAIVVISSSLEISLAFILINGQGSELEHCLAKNSIPNVFAYIWTHFMYISNPKGAEEDVI